MSAPDLSPKPPLASGTLWGSAAALLVAGAALLGIDLDQAQVSETLTALGVVITAATMIWDRFRPRRPLQMPGSQTPPRGDGTPPDDHDD